jgi:hypothetical protein
MKYEVKFTTQFKKGFAGSKPNGASASNGWCFLYARRNPDFYFAHEETVTFMLT